MNILLSNDDGIDSPFLRILAEVFSENHDVVVAAPAKEQSWIGKAMSRRGSVQLEEEASFPCLAYKLTGTPSDCVNIALEHLCIDTPDAVVSGINIGHNAGLSFIASSGTIGAALEGALQRFPAIAASMYLDPEQFKAIGERENPLTEQMENHVRAAAEILVSRVKDIIKAPTAPYGIVHSFNFPCRNIEKARIVKARAARTISRSLFNRQGNSFQFEYHPLETMNSEEASDRELIHGGDISHTVINFNSLDNTTY